jgi:hypothetical protein
MADAPGGKRDFFVSFNQADRAWATWIAWALEEAGYSVFFQDWDFTGNFVLEMDKAHAQSRCTVAVLSPDYLPSRFAAPEWAARFAQDVRRMGDGADLPDFARHLAARCPDLIAERGLSGILRVGR